jgi:TPR repeat protein
MQLAFRYIKGEGVPKDNIHAYKWFYIAEKGGEPTARKALPLLSRKMSRSEIAEAKAMADETMNKNIIKTSLLCELYQQFCGK